MHLLLVPVEDSAEWMWEFTQHLQHVLRGGGGESVGFKEQNVQPLPGFPSFQPSAGLVLFLALYPAEGIALSKAAPCPSWKGKVAFQREDVFEELC